MRNLTTLILKFSIFSLFVLSYQTAWASCPGCCSSHGGIANYCSTSGRIYCADGTVSPTCTCSSCGVASPQPSPTPQPGLTNQYIYFGIAPVISVHQSGTILATATSGLPVTLTSTTPSVCSLSGSTVTGISEGTCEIVANQSGSTSYLPYVGGLSYLAAAQASQTFNISPASVATPPVFARGIYDGIYLWTNDRYLSIHQNGDVIIASIYWAFKGGNITVDTFDLMNGKIDGNKATINGTRLFRGCTTNYDLAFNSDSTLTVTVKNIANSNTYTLDPTLPINYCSNYFTETPIESTFTIPRIF